MTEPTTAETSRGQGYGYDPNMMYQQQQMWQQQQAYMAQQSPGGIGLAKVGFSSAYGRSLALWQGYGQGFGQGQGQGQGFMGKGQEPQGQPGPQGQQSQGFGKSGGKSGGGGKNNSGGSSGLGGASERSKGGGKAAKSQPTEMTLEEYQAEQKRKAAEKKEKMLKQQEEARAAAKARAEAFERGELPVEEPKEKPKPEPEREEVQAPPAAKAEPEVEKPMPAEPEDDWEAEAEKEETPAPVPAPAPAPAPKKEIADSSKAQKAPAPQPQEEEPEEVSAEPAEVKVDGKDADRKVPDPRPHLNVVFIGHVDAGKSTTCGNILFLCGMVDERTIEKYKQEAANKAGESWFLAFIMDTSEEEKVKGKTVEVGRAAFETTNRRFTILDAPGHKSYVPNMIAGASAADVGVLLVSARKGEFETGFEKGGQTCEHALLAKTLGVEKLVIAINKMDDPTVEWDEKRYNDIVKKIGAFLKKSGYKDDQVIFLPMSGLMGDNIKERKGTPAWYTGLTLLDSLDGISVAGRKADGPLRIPMMEGYKDMGAVTAIGKIEQGTVRPGMKCVVMPTNNKCQVTAVYINDVEMQFATCGENVTLKMSGIGDEELKKGYVMCADKVPIPVVSKFKATIHVIELGPDRPVMTSGYVAVMHAHTASEECEILKLYETMVIQTKKKEKNPQFARPDSVVVCSIKLARPTSVDTFTSSPQLGRFTLRVDGRTIAIGKITELPKSAGDA
ncbi:Eukaryotic peptide chain release factor GTP-binding subunit [Symbiodinium microadriaticum]|uniref:Eukaryotic peptide chain release factor GTP-binding subunit n=2 Tax=Symbiodinium TaxID=2949 RepID=A0A1Q9CJ98_SYMMI|nr:Eukaryotic peptide chain release factor GTP-binding subunit [Symbiodinium microadriaticum]